MILRQATIGRTGASAPTRPVELPVPGIKSKPYVSAQVSVHITRKLTRGVVGAAPALRASEPTIDPQYVKPASTVTTADTRNHHRARSISPGMTLPLVVMSSSFMNGMFTRLKKYSRPTQVMPATKWIQRRIIKKLVWKSCGKEISPFIKAQSSGGIYVAETVQETSGKGKELCSTSSEGGFLASRKKSRFLFTSQAGLVGMTIG